MSLDDFIANPGFSNNTPQCPCTVRRIFWTIYVEFSSEAIGRKNFKSAIKKAHFSQLQSRNGWKFSACLIKFIYSYVQHGSNVNYRWLRTKQKYELDAMLLCAIYNYMRRREKWLSTTNEELFKGRKIVNKTHLCLAWWRHVEYIVIVVFSTKYVFSSYMSC